MRSDCRNRISTLLNTANVSSPRNILTWHCWYLNHGFQMTGHTDQTACPTPWLSCHIPSKEEKNHRNCANGDIHPSCVWYLSSSPLHQKALNIIALRGFNQPSSPRTGCSGTLSRAAVGGSRVAHEGWSPTLPCTQSPALLVLLPYLCLQPHHATELHNWPVPWPLNMINIKN